MLRMDTSLTCWTIATVVYCGFNTMKRSLHWKIMTETKERLKEETKTENPHRLLSVSFHTSKRLEPFVQFKPVSLRTNKAVAMSSNGVPVLNLIGRLSDGCM